jgi:chaperonin GroEL
MDEAKDDAIKLIKEKSLSIEANFEKLLHVASISASDNTIGDFIYDIIQDIGIYGHIEVKSSGNTKDRIDKVKGIKYHKGFYAPQFLSDLNKMQWKASKVYIVLFDDTVRTMGDLDPYIKSINGDDQGHLVKNNPILFVVNDVEPVVLQTLINNKLMYPANFNIMITEHDGFGDRKTEIMNDIAALTSASRGTAEEFGQIGFAEEVIVDEDTTSILGGLSESGIVDELIHITKTRLEDEDISESDKVYYKRRLATLAGGVAVIHVGAPTEVEMKEKKDRIDDAAEAVKAAIDRGISIGGGYTFVQCALELMNNGINKPGYGLLLDSLLAPLRQLCKNSDLEYKEIFTGLQKGDKGYNVVSNRFYPIEDYNVFDPTGVLIDSITNATSVAKSILSIEKAIHNI